MRLSHVTLNATLNVFESQFEAFAAQLQSFEFRRSCIFLVGNRSSGETDTLRNLTVA